MNFLSRMIEQLITKLRLRSFFNLTIIIAAVFFLTGCFPKAHIALDNSYDQKIPATKLIIAKKQDGIELVTTVPPTFPIGYFFGPAVILAEAGVKYTYLYGTKIIEKRDFEQVRKDVLNLEIESRMQALINEELTKNIYLKFVDVEVVNAKNKKEILKVFTEQDSRFVAFLEPKYTIEDKVSKISMEVALSIYDKEKNWKNKNKMPKPIYKTTVYHTYKLKDASAFRHSKNIARWKEDDCKLLKDELCNGAQKLALNIANDANYPFVFTQ